MLINLSVENWMSFRDPVSFSMVASRERQHGDRVARVAKHQTRILPFAAIYGSNASGKTNFFRALEFVKRLVVKGTEVDDLIIVEPFLLDSKCISKPTHFGLDMLIDEIFYEFSFSVTSQAVVSEKLVRIVGAREEILYKRSEGNIVFAPSLDKEEGVLNFVFDGTRDNQLFLTNSISQNQKIFSPVYNWIKNTLVLVNPDSKLETFHFYLDKSSPLSSFVNSVLPKLDTGISRLGGEKIPLELIPPEIKGNLQENTTTTLFGPSPYRRVVVSRKAGQIVAQKLVAYHSANDGTEVTFDFDMESDGTQRLIDLLPAFFQSSAHPRVVFIDELDRSLHHLLA